MEPKDIKDTIDKINREWEEMKVLLSGRGAAEEEKFGKRLRDTEAKLDEISNRIGQLELKLQRPRLGPDEAKGELSAEAVARKDAFLTWCRKGADGLAPEQRKLLYSTKNPDGQKLMTVSDDTTGGVFAPPELANELIRGIVEFSPVRSVVRVRTTSNRAVKVPKRTGTFSAVWVGETETRSETLGLTYAWEEIPTHEIYAFVDISNQDLEDADFDLEGEIRVEAVEQFAKAEGQAVIAGSGVKKPEGFLTNAAVAQDLSGVAGAISYDGMVDVSHNIKEGYLANAQFVFKLKTLGAIRKLKDSQGNPIWAPMVAGAPATVLGFPYTILQDMPDVGAANTPVAFGDFRRAYWMVDRVAIEVLRDPFTQATKGVTRFIIRKRVGGQVVLAEAIRKLKSNNA